MKDLLCWLLTLNLYSFSVSQSRPTEGAHFWAQKEEAEKMLMNSSIFETRKVKLAGFYFVGCSSASSLVTFDLPLASTIALLTSGCFCLLGGKQAEVQTGNPIGSHLICSQGNLGRIFPLL